MNLLNSNFFKALTIVALVSGCTAAPGDEELIAGVGGAGASGAGLPDEVVGSDYLTACDAGNWSGDNEPSKQSYISFYSSTVFYYGEYIYLADDCNGSPDIVYQSAFVVSDLVESEEDYAVLNLVQGIAIAAPLSANGESTANGMNLCNIDSWEQDTSITINGINGTAEYPCFDVPAMSTALFQSISMTEGGAIIVGDIETSAEDVGAPDEEEEFILVD